MNSSKLALLLTSALASLALATPGFANTVTVTSGPFVDSGSFNSGSLPSNWTATGPNAAVVSGSVLGKYTAPVGDNTPYAYVSSNSSLNANYSAAPISSFSLYWGTIDGYNSISFTGTDGTVSTYTGNDLGISLSNSPTDYVTFTDSGAAWKSVTFLSTFAAFEFDDVKTAAAGAATPEPVSLALFGTGLLVAGFAAVRRRQR